MLKKLTNNLGLKLISVVFALILWLVVVNIDDPVSFRTYSNIPVTVLNETTITEQGKVYEILDSSNTISIEVKAKRSVLDDLSASDFSATADMQEMDVELGLVPITVSAQRYASKIEEITKKTNNLKVSIEDLETKQFAINDSINGTPTVGYAIGDISLSPNVLKLSGPASVIDSVAKVIVKIDVDGMNSNLDMVLAPVLLDKNGGVIDSTGISFNYTQVHCEVKMLETKSINLNFEVTGEPAEGYQFIKLESTPASVNVKGDSSVLEQLSSININSSELDISNATQNAEFLIDISDYIPKGVELVDIDESNVAVTAIISGLKTKSVTIPVTQLKVENLTEGLKVSFASNDSINLEVKGTDKEISNLTEGAISAWIDLSGYSKGDYNVNVNFNGTNEVEIINDVSVGIKISDKTDNLDKKEETSKDAAANDKVSVEADNEGVR